MANSALTNAIGGVVQSVGLNRDSHWWILQLVALAGIVAAAGPDVITSQFAWLGIHLSATASHWVLFISAAIGWLAGKMDSSPLPAAAPK